MTARLGKVEVLRTPHYEKAMTMDNNNPCIFCKLESRELIAENDLAAAFYDGFPVSKGHTLVVPKRHAATCFDLTEDEMKAMRALALEVKAKLDAEYAPDGYNVGFNCGTAGGQTVFHCHMHIIPRYLGDIEHPAGGIRRIFPEDEYSRSRG